MNIKRLDAAISECIREANFYIKGYRFHKNFGGIKGNKVVEAYGDDNYAVYAKY